MVDNCGFIGRPFGQKEPEWAMEQLDTEVVETVAGVARLLRRAAELVWMQADAAGARSSRQLLALGIDSAADEASGLLPRRARLDGPTPFGDNPADLLASAEQLLRRALRSGESCSATSSGRTLRRASRRARSVRVAVPPAPASWAPVAVLKAPARAREHPSKNQCCSLTMR